MKTALIELKCGCGIAEYCIICTTEEYRKELIGNGRFCNFAPKNGYMKNEILKIIEKSNDTKCRNQTANTE